MSYDAPRRAAVLLGLPLLVLSAAGTASAAGAPAPLDVTVSGPATGEAGGTGEFAVTVANVGSAKADEIRLRMQLPEGITVRSVRATDTWTCVLGPLRCTLKAGLKPGEAAETLDVVLHYDGLVEGRQEIAAVAAQEPDRGAARFDRGATTVDVAPAPDWAGEEPAADAPSATPTAAPPPAAAPAPAAPPAAAPPAAEPAPAPAAPRRAVAPAPAAPAPAPAAEPAPAPPAPAEEPPAEEPPAVLPFADTEAGAETQDADETVAAPRGSGDLSGGGGSAYTAALAVVFGLLLVTYAVLLARIAARRRGLIA